MEKGTILRFVYFDKKSLTKENVAVIALNIRIFVEKRTFLHSGNLY